MDFILGFIAFILGVCVILFSFGVVWYVFFDQDKSKKSCDKCAHVQTHTEEEPCKSCKVLQGKYTNFKPVQNKR